MVYGQETLMTVIQSDSIALCQMDLHTYYKSMGDDIVGCSARIYDDHTKDAKRAGLKKQRLHGIASRA
eukprot:6589219-Pyramimonas_sp.AAC.1